MRGRPQERWAFGVVHALQRRRAPPRAAGRGGASSNTTLRFWPSAEDSTRCAIARARSIVTSVTSGERVLKPIRTCETAPSPAVIGRGTADATLANSSTTRRRPSVISLTEMGVSGPRPTSVTAVPVPSRATRTSLMTLDRPAAAMTPGAARSSRSASRMMRFRELFTRGRPGCDSPMFTRATRAPSAATALSTRTDVSGLRGSGVKSENAPVATTSRSSTTKDRGSGCDAT